MIREHLKEFIALAEGGNFTDAADQLFLSQSTLSRHIKELETELGVQLFTRTTKCVLLNEYGQKFLPYAQCILNVESECLRAFSNEVLRMNGQLRIGVTVLDGRYEYMSIFSEFQKKHQNYQISFIESCDSALAESVTNGLCDFAVVFSQPNKQLENMERITIKKDVLVAVLSLDHPLSAFQSLSLAQLKDEAAIFQDVSSVFYQTYMDTMQQFNFSPNILFRDFNTKSLLKMVAQNMGITFRPKQLALTRSRQTVAIADTQPTMELNVDLIYRKGTPRTAAEADLIAFFRDSLGRENGQESFL